MNKNGKKKKKLVWWVSGGLVLLIALVVILFMAFGTNNNTLVEVAKVEKTEKLTAMVTASGEIKPKNFVDIQSEIAGVISQLYVKEGDHVQQGQLLLKIDPIQTEMETRIVEFTLRNAEEDSRIAKNQIEESKLNVSISEANLVSAMADLDQAKAQMEQEELSFKRRQQLHEDNLISTDEYDLAKSQYKSAKSRVASAESRIAELQTRIDVSKSNIRRMEMNFQSAMNRVEQSKASFTRAQDMLKKTVIMSPLAGIITKLEVETGERAVPGTMYSPQATLMTIADLSIIETEVKVDETDIIQLRLNQPVKVKVDALPDQPLDGHVTEIGNSAIQAGQAVGGTDQAKDFKVVIQLDNPPEILRPGLSATAEITTAVKVNVLAIPLQAVIMREVELDPRGNVIHPWDKKGDAKKETEKNDKKVKPVEKQGVFVIDKTNRAVFTIVETGITGETDIEITKGLNQNDEIAVGSFRTLRTLKDGDMVMKKKSDGKVKKDTAEQE